MKSTIRNTGAEPQSAGARRAAFSTPFVIRHSSFIIRLPILIALGLLAGCAANDPQHSALTLKEAFKDDFFVGVAVNDAQFSGKDERSDRIVRTQFNSISPENVLKWESVHPQAGQYDFSGPDRYVDFGEANRMFIIGHTLIWHNQTPAWVFQDGQGNPVDRGILLARMREHIHTVVGRYKGRINGWDVVNEAINEDGSWRETQWYKIIGEDFIAHAFQYAREADPGAELYYNDYALEDAPKRNGVIALVRKLKAQGVPITGIGSQMHVKLATPTIADADTTLEEFGKLGLKVMVTELDVDVLPSASKYRGADITTNFVLRADLDPYTNGLPASVQQALADRYTELFKLFLKHRDKIDRVTFWCVTDGDSWLNYWPVRSRTAYPLLFDRGGKPKPAFEAVIRTAHEAQR
jgi:endo-1,4-beta-xylanase